MRESKPHMYRLTLMETPKRDLSTKVPSQQSPRQILVNAHENLCVSSKSSSPHFVTIQIVPKFRVSKRKKLALKIFENHEQFTIDTFLIKLNQFEKNWINKLILFSVGKS